jgi:18S rRNA (adenine1779-N6/adenine1780-N6)-dimethyltransferase
LTLVQNYKVYCSLNNIPIDESLANISAGDDDVMMDSGDLDMDVDGDDGAQENDEDAGGADSEDEDMPAFFKEAGENAKDKDAKTPSRNPKSKVGRIVRAKIAKVLNATGLAEKRSRQCDQNNFLKLLLGMLTSPISLPFLKLTGDTSIPRGGNPFLMRVS